MQGEAHVRRASQVARRKLIYLLSVVFSFPFFSFTRENSRGHSFDWRALRREYVGIEKSRFNSCPVYIMRTRGHTRYFRTQRRLY